MNNFLTPGVQKFIYYCTTAFISAAVLVMFVVKPGINDDIHSKFADMVYGNAYKPFVYRTLLPTAVRVLSAPVPGSVKNSVAEKIEKTGALNKLFKKLRWEKQYAVEYFFAMLLMFLSLWGFSIALMHLFKLFYKTSLWFGYSVSVLALLGLPPMFQYTSFLYDFPALLLYTLGLIFLYKQDWKKFLPLFLIACLNKETTILLTVIFFIYFRKKLQNDLFRKLLVAQISVFIVVKIFLSLIFKNNPGTFVEFHLIDHNLRLLTGYDLTLAVSVLVIFLLVFAKWFEKPKFVKVTFWMIIPLAALTFFLGYLDELRDYYEVYPAVIILISHSIARLLNVNLLILKER